MSKIEKLLAERVGEVRAIVLPRLYRWDVGRLSIRGKTPTEIVDWILTEEGV